MDDLISRRSTLGVGMAVVAGSLSGCTGRSESGENVSAGADTESSTVAAPPETPLNGDISQQGELSLSSPAFDDGGQLPDYVGGKAANENPELVISGVPENANALVLAVDDPDARPVTGHVFTHWTVWDIDPTRQTIPRAWSPADATEGFNDIPTQGYSGPAPPKGSHTYRFKLLALDSSLGMPPETRKTRLGSAITFNADILAATQLIGTYSADQ